MTHIRTIEEDYEYQMGETVASFLEQMDKKPSDFETPEELMNFIWDNPKAFGRCAYDTMGQWASEDHWMSIAEKAA